VGAYIYIARRRKQEKVSNKQKTTESMILRIYGGGAISKTRQGSGAKKKGNQQRAKKKEREMPFRQKRVVCQAKIYLILKNGVPRRKKGVGLSKNIDSVKKKKMVLSEVLIDSPYNFLFKGNFS
jgi:hypothetical protein